MLRPTEQVAVAPAPRVEGEQLNELTVGRTSIVTVAVAFVPPPEAVKTADVKLVTGPAVALNPTELVPAGTVIEEGTGNAPLALDTATVIPPDGAA